MRRLGLAVITALLLCTATAQAATKPSSLKLTPVGTTALNAEWVCNTTCQEGAIGFSYVVKDYTELPEKTVAKGLWEPATTRAHEITGLTAKHKYSVALGTCLNKGAEGCNSWPENGVITESEFSAVEKCATEPEKKGCGYPGPNNTGATGTLTATSENNLTTAKHTYKNLKFTGPVTVEAEGITLENDEIVSNAAEYSLLTDPTGVTLPATVLKNVTINGGVRGGGKAGGERGVNDPGKAVVIENSKITGCGVCIYSGGEVTIKNSYLDANGGIGETEAKEKGVEATHYEDVFDCGGSGNGHGPTTFIMEHTTSVNPFDNANLFFCELFGVLGEHKVFNSFLNQHGTYIVDGGGTTENGHVLKGPVIFEHDRGLLEVKETESDFSSFDPEKTTWKDVFHDATLELYAHP